MTMAQGIRANIWLAVFRGIFILAFLVLAARLVQIQALEHDKYAQIALGQHSLEQSLPAPRGKIYDRNMRPLADTVAAESVWLYKPNLGSMAPLEAARRIAKVTGDDPNELYKRLTSGPKYVRLARHISKEAADGLAEARIPGLEFAPDPLRYYPSGHAAAQLLGFCNADCVGMEGLELQFQRYLQGQDGYRIMFRDALGRQISTPQESTVLPRPGYDLVLTMDLWIQTVLEEAMEKVCNTSKPKSGVGIVMDVRTGEILAMASWPFYDPNDFSKYKTEYFRNKPVADIYEPGSMLKTFTAAAAIENDVVSPDTVINCENGRYALHGRTITDASGHHYGNLSFTEVIAKSSNVGTSKVAEMLGATRLYDSLVKFGFKEKSGIGLWGEELPWLRPPSRWSLKSVASISFGYEISVTPVSLMKAYGAIAGDGTVSDIKIISGVLDNEGMKAPEFEKPPAPRRTAISADTVQKLRKILRQVVLDGTCTAAKIKEYEIAGKTGTANKVVNGHYDSSKTLSSFIGFAPLDNPRILVLVSVDEPKVGQYGGTVAGPAVAETISRTLLYLGVPPKTDK